MYNQNCLLEYAGNIHQMSSYEAIGEATFFQGFLMIHVIAKYLNTLSFLPSVAMRYSPGYDFCNILTQQGVS